MLLLADGASLQNERIVFIVLIQLAVIILAARARAALAARFGQLAVVGEIAAGIESHPVIYDKELLR